MVDRSITDACLSNPVERDEIEMSVVLFSFRSVIYNGRNSQAFGLIVLLISKAAGHLNAEPAEEDKAAGVLHRWMRCTRIYAFVYRERQTLLRTERSNA